MVEQETASPSRSRSRGLLISILDQSASSASNLLASLLVARNLDAESFGIFSILFTSYLLAVTLQRQVLLEPFLIRDARSTAPHEISRELGAASLLLSIPIATITAAVGWAYGGQSRWACILLAAAFPLLLWQDCGRYVSLTAHSGVGALASDAGWGLVTLCSLLALLSLSPHVTLLQCLSVWAIPGALATALFPWIAAGALSPRLHVQAWASRNGPLALGLVGDFSLLYGVQQAAIYLISAISGATTVGAIRGSQVLLAPLNPVTMGATVYATPRASAMTSENGTRWRSFLLAVSAGLAVLVATWAIVVSLIPDTLGPSLLGETWLGARHVFLPVALGFLFNNLAYGAITALRITGRVRVSITVRAFVSPIALGAGPLMGYYWGAWGAAWGIAFSAALATTLLWVAVFSIHTSKEEASNE